MGDELRGVCLNLQLTLKFEKIVPVIMKNTRGS